jgi:hypothetical protein
MSGNMWRMLLMVILFSLAFSAVACTGAVEPAAELLPVVEGNLVVDVTEEAASDTGGGSASDRRERELVAVVQAIDGEQWTVNGQTFLITAETEVKGNPTTGERVKIHFTAQDDGTFLVLEVELAAPAATGRDTDSARSVTRDEFYGIVEAINGDVWTIAGHRVTVTPSTEIKGNAVIGDGVKVHTLTQADGSLLAREIEREQDDDGRSGDDGRDVEFYGTVQAMNDTIWTIAGRDVTISPRTELEGNILLGSQVKVEAWLQADGTLLAHEIELEYDDDDRYDDDDDRYDDDDDRYDDDDDRYDDDDDRYDDDDDRYDDDDDRYDGDDDRDDDDDDDDDNDDDDDDDHDDDNDDDDDDDD